MHILWSAVVFGHILASALDEEASWTTPATATERAHPNLMDVPIDPECARSLAAARQPPPSSSSAPRSVALLLRGDAFRNWNSQHVNARCGWC